MEDSIIIDLYWARSEQAITETASKYGNYCYSIAYNILSNPEDTEEAINDTYIGAWNSMPPASSFHFENIPRQNHTAHIHKKVS